MPTAEEIRRRIIEHGLSIRDRVIATMPQRYSLMVEQIRSIARSYRGDFDTFLTNLSSIKGLDLLVIYTALLAVLSKHKSLSDEEILKIGDSFDRHIYDVFSASKARRALEEAGVEKEIANDVISGVVKALNLINNKYNSPYLWIAEQRRIERFENSVREVLFRNEGGNRVGRGVKLFLRLFIHDTNIPLAVRIAYTQENKKYILHGDMYTALVTLRSGAFEDVASITAERVKARVAKRLLCEAKEGGARCKDVVMRLESIRGLVRYVGKISGDPIVYERGAYDIGYRYCRDLKCEACPINDVCKRYTFIKLK
ncbi:hypothetical protein [Pyrobaculum aerophilum]|uniref:Uncharacterized protein n=2 Tax=Pyrobaculum aerophilum TaxID=13773 RepID=Q8ZYG1_PYRAE|nr:MULTISPECIES: hypothetical protein [Pyrobaculum]AAL63032.1 hypothetical protein PAE0796 [Pyrobaculum aerophilum str. IM2]MCX8136229.1 hypothetical protein [Pyrobaculum aerophilum]HII48195.1 hypothetical protein [Pyrobaculum aerophilum]